MFLGLRVVYQHTNQLRFLTITFIIIYFVQETLKTKLLSPTILIQSNIHPYYIHLEQGSEHN